MVDRRKHAVVTGATGGIGEATAIGLAKAGARVVLVGRDRARGEAALARVRAAGDPRATLLLADLSSQSEIGRLAAEFLAALPVLEVLVNNAGAIFMQRESTVALVEHVDELALRAALVLRFNTATATMPRDPAYRAGAAADRRLGERAAAGG